MKKRAKIVIATLILLIVMLPICWYLVRYYQAENNYLTYEIRIVTHTETEYNYTICLPILIYTYNNPKNKNIATLYSMQFNENNIHNTIEESTYGQVINISAKGSIDVEFSFTSKESTYIFSTREIKRTHSPPWYDGSYWIFFSTNSTTTPVTLEYTCEMKDQYGYVSGYKEIKCSLYSIGWFLVDGYEEYSIV